MQMLNKIFMYFAHTYSFSYYTTTFTYCQGHKQEYWCFYTIFTRFCCANKQRFSAAKPLHSLWRHKFTYIL